MTIEEMRHLDAVKTYKELEEVKAEIQMLKATIKQLEEAGDALYENSYPTKWDLPEANARKLKEQETWRKAKEAKP